MERSELEEADEKKKAAAEKQEKREAALNDALGLLDKNITELKKKQVRNMLLYRINQCSYLTNWMSFFRAKFMDFFPGFFWVHL